jgi:hypothetical protein
MPKNNQEDESADLEKFSFFREIYIGEDFRGSRKILDCL